MRSIIPLQYNRPNGICAIGVVESALLNFSKSGTSKCECIETELKNSDHSDIVQYNDPYYFSLTTFY